jgi:iron(III)-salmochelin esterase
MTSALHRAIPRRGFLAGAAALLPAAAGCRCGGAPPGSAGPSTGDPPATPGAVTGPWHELSFEPSAAYSERQRALLLVPEGAASLPIVIALHGRGETVSLDVGARGFKDYYGVERVDGRLRAPPITREDLLGFTTNDRLAKINASLAAQPYRGVVLACPYAPDLRALRPAAAEPYGRFLTETLLPRAREKAAAPAAPERTGIDGVSMGGRLALWIGFRFAELFGAVGAMQPALRVEEAASVAALASAARAKNPGLRLRLLSSDDDPFLAAVKAASAKMTDAGVSHDLVIVPGPHNYEFNRGPGCAEMLLWQERALRALPPP